MIVRFSDGRAVRLRAETGISAMGFYDAFDQFVKMEGHLAQTPTKHWAYSTNQKFTTLKNHLISFDDSLSFEDITMEKLADFVTFEQNTLGLIDSTVKKHIVYLKWFLRWAVKMDITKNNDFEKFSTGIPTQETKVIFLTADELKKVKTGDLVRFDEEGYMYIVGRIKNLIILSNGENVSPESIEEPFYKCDKLRDCLVKEDELDGKKVIAIEILPRNENSQLISDIGLDSLTILLLSLAIENKFNIKFEGALKFNTVGEVIDYIKSKE